MANSEIKTRLGRGLDAIFGEYSGQKEKMSTEPTTLYLSEIKTNIWQPRKNFDEESLSKLSDSIKEHGVLQPIVVRPSGGKYQIIAGERRFRASKMAGLIEIPVIIKNFDDKQSAIVALIENLQREDLSPIEEARGYQSLMKIHDMTQEDVAETVGKSRSAVANSLRLLTLPQSVLELVSEGKLSAGHARALLSLSNEKDMEIFAKKAVSKAFSVRQLEKSVHDFLKKPKKAENCFDEFFRRKESDLKSKLGREVRLSGTSERGVLQIEFHGIDDLEVLVSFLN